MKHVTLQKIVAHEFWYDPRSSDVFRHFLHHPQVAYKLRELKLYTIKVIRYDTSVCRYGKTVAKCDRICNTIPG